MSALPTPPDRGRGLEDLADDLPAYDFHQAMRRIACAFPEAPPPGTAKRPADEPVRVGQEPWLAFPPADLAGFVLPDGSPGRLTVRFFGLFGPQGPLPLHLTAYARDRLSKEHDPTFVDFCDVLHHRLLLLYHRIWAEARPVADLDRGAEGRFAGYVGALIGAGEPRRRARDAWSRAAERGCAGYLAGATRHPEGLRAMVEDLFGVKARVEEFVGGWLWLAREDLLALGRVGRLGADAVLGRRIYARQHRFRLRLGPLAVGDFERFLPGGQDLTRLLRAVRTALGDAFAWDLVLVLDRAEVPPAQLGRVGRLGRTAWLEGKPHRRTRDADDLVLAGDRLAAAT